MPIPYQIKLWCFCVIFYLSAWLGGKISSHHHRKPSLVPLVAAYNTKICVTVQVPSAVTMVLTVLTMVVTLILMMAVTMMLMTVMMMIVKNTWTLCTLRAKEANRAW
jgi:hypothetical protein